MPIRCDLITQLRLAGLPAPEAEYRFHSKRRWRFDYAWPGRKLAVEQEGGTWSRGRHVRPRGYAADCEKYSEAAVLGWTVLRFTTEQIRSGQALALILRAFTGGRR